MVAITSILIASVLMSAGYALWEKSLSIRGNITVNVPQEEMLQAEDELTQSDTENFSDALSDPDAISGKTPSHEATLDETSSDELLSDDLLPGESLPDEALPDRVLPDKSLPDEELPEDTLVDETLSGEALTGEILPDEALTNETLPDETLPHEDIAGSDTTAVMEAIHNQSL